MSLWTAVLLACAAAFGLKLLGYLVPARGLEGEWTSRVMTLLPVALLAGLVLVQAAASGARLVVDARLAAVALAIVLLLLRASFLVVVAAAAVLAATLRALGWG
jgi:hypothetical protein